MSYKGVAMKGTQINKLRESLELSAGEFASLMGVQTSSVYRWESAGNKTTKVEGFARQVFRLLESLQTEEQQKIVKSLRRGGWMAGLHTLFGMAMKKE